LRTQAYALYPNPNDGNVNIVQKVADTGLVSIDVADIMGRSVYRQNARFTEGTHKLSLQHLAAGVYVANLLDERGRQYVFKFVKQ